MSSRSCSEAADLLQNPGRPHEALAFYRELFRIDCRIKHLTDEERPQTSPTSADALFNNLNYAGERSKTPMYGRVPIAVSWVPRSERS
jgi:hypothetical protein